MASTQGIQNRPTLATGKKRQIIQIGRAPVSAGPKTVVVLGVERGGTSMVAGVIRAMGISMGERAGLNHEDPRFLTEDHDRLRPYIAQRNQQAAVWGFKMPKASLHLDFFAKVLRNPVYVVAYRNPVSIVDSWEQRGAGQALDVLERINQYQSSLSDFFRNTNAPVLLVNYERAVSKNGGAAFVAELAELLKWDATPEQLERAAQMMTGDGGGYVNLPEHFLEMTPIAPLRAERVLPTVAEGPDPRDAQGWIAQDKLRPLVVLRRPDGSNFPRRFVLRVDFTHGQGTDSPDGTVRVFVRYTDDFINAHCRRPILVNGVNYVDVETSGLADAIAIGPWQIPARYKAQVTVLEGDAEAVPTAPPLQPTPPRPGLAQRVRGKLKRMLASGAQSVARK